MALKSFLDGKILAELNFPDLSTNEPLLVFLHGWGRNKSDFSSFYNFKNSVAFDFPGFGSSPELKKVYDAHVYAEDISDALNELTPESLAHGVLLVGHSLGGRVAACLGTLRPDLIRGIIFIGAPLIRYPSNVKSPFKFRLAKKLNKMGLISDRKMEENRRKFGSADYRNSSGLLRESLVKIINESYELELSELECPVTFLWGENDTAAPVKTAYDSEKLVRNSIGVEVIAGATHDVHSEHPDALKDRIELMTKAIS